MLHVPGMPEGVHVSFSPEHLPVSVPAQPDRYTPPALVGAGTPSEALTALLDAHELAYGHALCSEAYGLPDLAERRQAEEETFRALLHTPMHSDADRVAYAIAVISRQAHSLGDASATERDHPMAVAYRNLRFGEHAREPEAMRHVGRQAEPEASADPILAAIATFHDAKAAFDAIEAELEQHGTTPERWERESALGTAEGRAERAVWQTVPTTPAGRRALVEFSRTQVQRRTNPNGDVDDNAWLLGLILDAFAAMVGADWGNALPQASDEADPIFAAIEAHRAAHAAWYPLMLAWNDMPGGTPEYATAEVADTAARQIERDAFRALLTTRPTTAAGCLGLTAYVSGTVAENDHHLDKDTLEVLTALRDSAMSLALKPGEALPAHAATPDIVNSEAPSLDLSGCSIRQITRLYEAFHAVYDHFSSLGQLPCFWEKDETGSKGVNYNAAGDIVDREADRLAWISSICADEIVKRQPKSEIERDDALTNRLMHEMICNGRIHDPALMRDIATAWGA